MGDYDANCNFILLAMENSSVFSNLRVFDGQKWTEYPLVALHDSGVVQPLETTDEPAQAIKDGRTMMLVPAFLDLQIYGAGSRLFAQYPDDEALDLLVSHNRSEGTAGCLVTIPTQPMDVILTCLKTVSQYMRQGKPGILGMHLEGPFMHPQKRGAHVLDWILAPTIPMTEQILEAADGALKMVTLAPECVSDAVIERFRQAGVVVSAGHSAATYAEGAQFAHRGVTAVTHLFNAMSAFHHRDTGLPGAVFESDSLMASIIPDGIHVDYAALRIAKKLMGERLFFITDAVTPVSAGAYQHMLQTDRYTLPDGTLSGSAITMLQGIRNAVTKAGLPLDECLRMASLYPARVLDIQEQWGHHKNGLAGKMVLISESFEWVGNYGF
jgi:N-acetylglucosamine-6-phosphate deacetylase